MSNILKVAAATALIAVSASASAWWGGPVSSWADDFFGDGVGDFDMNMSASGHGFSRGYGYDRSYYGPYAYGPYAYAPYAYGYPGAPVAPQAPVAEAK